MCGTTRATVLKTVVNWTSLDESATAADMYYFGSRQGGEWAVGDVKSGLYYVWRTIAQTECKTHLAISIPEKLGE